jgi:hypothetical protein
MSCASHAVSIDYPNSRPIWWSVIKLYFLCVCFCMDVKLRLLLLWKNVYCLKIKLLPGQHQLCVVTVYKVSGAGPFSVISMDNVRRSTLRCYRMRMFKERVLTRMCVSKRGTNKGASVFCTGHFILVGPLNWAGCLDEFAAHMWEGWQRCNYKMLNVMPGRTRQFSTCRRRWKQILRMIFGKQAVETDWIRLVWIARWSAVGFLLNRGFTLPLINCERKWIQRI